MSVFKNLMRTKSIESFSQEQNTSKDDKSRLKKCLSAFDLVLLGIGAIIGTGIFVLTGVTAATVSGPAVTVSFLISGIVCTFAALCYAELASKIGGCGGAYGYSYALFGECIGFLVGWMLILEYGIATTAVAVGWSGYFSDLFQSLGYPLPDQLRSGILSGSENGIINLPAFSIIIILMFLLIAGVRQSATLNAALVAIKIFAIIVFIAVAGANLDTSLWIPYMPFGWFEVLPNGDTVGVIAGAALVFFAYVGFDAVSTAAEETNNPQRDVPIGIIGSLVFCSVLYIIVSALMTGVVSYTELNVSSPASHALQLIGFTAASAVISAAVIAGLVSVMLVLYYGLTRVLFALSRDQLLPGVFSTISPTTQTPVRVIVGCGFIMAIMAGFLPFRALVETINIGTLSAFVFVCIGVILMRIKHPDVKGTVQLPGKFIIPVLGAVSCVGLILSLPSQTMGVFALWMLTGAALYFIYSYKASKLHT